MTFVYLKENAAGPMWRNVLLKQATNGFCVGVAFPGETRLNRTTDSFCICFRIIVLLELNVSHLVVFMQIPVIPEDIFFTSEFTEVAKLEDSNTGSIGLVSKIIFVVSVWA